MSKDAPAAAAPVPAGGSPVGQDKAPAKDAEAPASPAGDPKAAAPAEKDAADGGDGGKLAAAVPASKLGVHLHTIPHNPNAPSSVITDPKERAK